MPLLQQVGPAQYDLGMKASKRVHVQVDEERPTFRLACTASIGPCSTRPKRTSSAGSSRVMDSAASDAAARQPAKPALYGEATLAQEFAEKFGLTDQEPSEDEPTEPRSPLTWFGMMVPQALRNSQSSFERASEVCIKLAELASRLVNAPTIISSDSCNHTEAEDIKLARKCVPGVPMSANV